jgi:hypothetical protein
MKLQPQGRQDLADKLLKQAVVGLDNCWLWTGHRTVYGYGMVHYQGKQQYVHRLSYELFNGEFPKNMNICHKCDVKLCLNPDHLFIGTQKDNIHDMIRKERNSRGERHVGAVLTEAAVHFIREHYKPKHPELGFQAMGRKFGVDGETVRDAYVRRTWKHIK